MAERSIQVCIVDDDDLIRETLAMIIGGTPGFEVVSKYTSGDEFLDQGGCTDEAVILMDIDMPGTRGTDCVARYKSEHPDAQVLMLTVHEDIEAVFESLRAGAIGYMVKHTPPARLLQAIEEVHLGGAPMSPEIARKVIGSFHPNTQNPLSEREVEVLRMLCDGENYKTIAEALFISANTVKAHIKSIYTKLHVNSRAQAVQTALKNRLV
ncbi:MAG: response regulator transcription factor [Flavobacteriales bacterium]|nr:response regulator transcription factor [Flavobacteriales bacterium]